jgi:hypothetical protein
MDFLLDPAHCGAVILLVKPNVRALVLEVDLQALRINVVNA